MTCCNEICERKTGLFRTITAFADSITGRPEGSGDYRAFMYGVGAFGQPGAAHTIELLRNELLQVMEQLRCQAPGQLPQYLL